MKRLNTQLIILACLVAATPTLRGESALALRVTPAIAAAPATVSVTVTVEPNVKNRMLVIEDESETYYRSSAVELEGERAVRTHWLVFHGLPPGEHRVSAAVYSANGRHTVVSTTVTVMGS